MQHDSDDHRIESEDQLTELMGKKHPLAVNKCRPCLDRYSREFIGRSPFVCVGTQSAEGRADVSPRGDPPGFVKVIDDNTLAIPDRPGNNRVDTMGNILANPSVGLLFMVPGFDDTLRVNGKARLSTDPALLAEMAVNGRGPRVAIVLDVEEAFLHCAKAFRRSNLWSSDALQDRDEMPTLGRMIMDQTSDEPVTQEDVDAADTAVEDDYRDRMY